MPRVTFLTTFKPKGDSPEIPTYEEGETYDLERSYAEKYKRLGLVKDAEPAPRPVRMTRAQQVAQEQADLLAAKMEARGKVVIPDDVSMLSEAEMIELGRSLSDDGDMVIDKDSAMKAIDAEKVLRSQG